MKQIWKQIAASAVMGLLAPGLVLATVVAISEHRETPENVASLTQSVSGTAQSETIPDVPQTGMSMTIPVLFGDGDVVQMDLDTYLVGVVLAEMPASFEPEAHKAQAVVARTYALKRFTGQPKHEGGAVCTDSACCQGYISPEDYLENGGTQAEVDEIRQDVLETSGEVLTYQGELIEATYFSCSGGWTEDALAVWGAEIPYLHATSSPGEENASHYTDTVFFTKTEFTTALGVELSGEPDTWLGDVSYTPGGGVDTLEIGGIAYKGTTLRRLLGLRSTAFTMTPQENGITVVTKGFGHRVGMSQYGADAMAVSGSSYEEILTHYYSGTVLENYTSAGIDN